VRHRRIAAPFVTSSLVALPLALAACAGPPVTSPIEDEPICADFESGAARTKMIGGLKHPVQLTIKRGSSVIFKTTVHGLRTDKDLATRVLLADDDETFTLEWAQCENERAARPSEPTGRETKGAAKYECGAAAVYKTEPLTTKKGDPKSHALKFPAPPNPACWQSTAPPAPAPADAGAPDAEAPAEDAGATDADAGAADSGATDAGATDAGATDAGKGAAAPK
jgi:hypothetical protein